MIDLAELRLMRAIADTPSLAAAARALDVTPPAVSQRLAVLEARLKLRLVERGSGGLRLTAEGEMMSERASQILADVTLLAEDLARRQGRVTGPLRVIAPLGYGRLSIAPILADFALVHCDVTPMLTLSDDPRGLMRTDGWDLMIHVGRLPDLDLPQRKLASNRRLLCAAPAYLKRVAAPEHPRELRGHRCGVIRENQADVSLWSFTRPTGARETIRIDPAFASNDGEVIRNWVLAGLGITERSEWSIRDDLRSGALVHVLPDWELPDAEIVALMNPKVLRAARIDALLERLVARLSVQ